MLPGLMRCRFPLGLFPLPAISAFRDKNTRAVKKASYPASCCCSCTPYRKCLWCNAIINCHICGDRVTEFELRILIGLSGPKCEIFQRGRWKRTDGKKIRHLYIPTQRMSSRKIFRVVYSRKVSGF